LLLRFAQRPQATRMMSRLVKAAARLEPTGGGAGTTRAGGDELGAWAGFGRRREYFRIGESGRSIPSVM